MNNNSMPKIVLRYRPNERRRLGRPYNRLLDKAERGLLRPNSRGMMIMIFMVAFLQSDLNLLKPKGFFTYHQL